MFLEILGEAGYSRWDARYEILSGNLLEPPTITKEVLFAPINLLRDVLHEPAPSSKQVSTIDRSDAPRIPPPFPATGLPIDEKILAVRKGKLSPLAIKRPSPVLRKSEREDSSQEVSAIWVIEHDEKTGWFCAVDESEAHLLFFEMNISKDVLDAWDINWQGSVLGNFAKALLNALESRSELYENPVRRVRMAVQAFKGQAETLIQQMNEENPNQTLWHQLERFFQYYPRDADTPMIWDQGGLRFWGQSTPNEVFPDNKININLTQPTPWLTGNQVFQIRTGIYSVHEILNYENSWDDLSLSEIGQRFFNGIRAEIERELSVQHVVVSAKRVIESFIDIARNENVHCYNHIKKAMNLETLGNAFKSADVIWIVGTPYWPPHLMWKQAQVLFGNDAEPLSYDVEFNPYRYKDERIQNLSDQNVVGILTQILGRAGLDRSSNKTVVLLTGMPLPGITDRSETLLFDWEDFEIAGRLDKLAEIIAIRERFEEKRTNLTVESGREKVEQVLGVSSSQANRILTKLRGGKRPTMQEQIHILLADGEKKTGELLAAIDGHPNAIKNELKRLVDMREIVKVRRAVYALP